MGTSERESEGCVAKVPHRRLQKRLSKAYAIKRKGFLLFLVTESYDKHRAEKDSEKDADAVT